MCETKEKWKMNGKQLVLSIPSDNDILKEHEQNAESRRKLFHYTNLESFLSIIRKKQIKFNRIDRVNDKQENEFFEQSEVSKLVFISCFSYEENENPHLWNMYTSGNIGIRMGFYLDENQSFKSCFPMEQLVQAKDLLHEQKRNDQIPYMNKGHLHPTIKTDWRVNKLIQKDIIYDIDKREECPIVIPHTPTEKNNYNAIYNMNAMGAIKAKAWNSEKESRIVSILRTTKECIEIPEYEYLLVPFCFEKLKKIEITFSPLMQTVEKDCIKREVETHLSGLNVECKDSEFDGKLRIR